MATQCEYSSLTPPKNPVFPILELLTRYLASSATPPIVDRESTIIADGREVIVVTAKVLGLDHIPSIRAVFIDQNCFEVVGSVVKVCQAKSRPGPIGLKAIANGIYLPLMQAISK